MKYTFKRSNEPLFWLVFGAGGMWSALFLPVTIFLLFLLPIFNPIEGTDIYYSFLHTFLGKLFIFCTITLCLWSGLHRIYHCLHDMKLASPLVKGACYSLAFVLSLIAAFLLITK